MFSAELPWCCFCAEIKVLGMERNFARIFYINNKNFWSQDLPERGNWVGTTHQGTPPLSWRTQVGCTHTVAPLMTPLILSHYSRKESGRKNYRVSRDGAAAKPCSFSGGQIWSSSGGPERGIFNLRHHQHISITNSMMLPTRK